MIKLIEIELFSFCNRKCEWCGNSIIDRHSSVKYLDNAIIDSIIQYLVSSNYSNYITFSRYNEPIYDTDCIINFINKVKDCGVKCKFITNTNGDYLTYDNIRLLSHYIDELTIMDYDGDKCSYYIDTFMIDNIVYTNHGIYGNINDMKICIHNFWDNSTISNRGEILNFKNEPALKKCEYPLNFIGIDYNGKVVQCCNARSDFSAHKPLVYGDLNISSLYDIVKKMNPNIDNSICRGCGTYTGRYIVDNGGIVYG